MEGMTVSAWAWSLGGALRHTTIWNQQGGLHLVEFESHGDTEHAILREEDGSGSACHEILLRHWRYIGFGEGQRADSSGHGMACSTVANDGYHF